MRAAIASVSLASCLTLGSAVLAADAAPAAPRPAFPQAIQGITLSTHLDGRDWAWDGTPPTLERLAGLGATWVAIHPYAGIARDGSVPHAALDPDSPPEYLARPIREAHRLGMRILIKPHIAYWGSGFGWRGEIDFETPEQWARFWSEYTRWILGLAAATADADGFVVGTELVHTLEHETQWRRLVTQVREVTHSPLTYAANWSSYEQVGFWDALDAIGIQAYFPLIDEAVDQPPSAAAIRRGWDGWMKRLSRYSARHRRPILFTELGYNHAFSAPARPWEYRTDGDGARGVQERCMRVALDAVAREPSVLGAFLWKWFPEPRPLGRNFQLATPGMMDVIRGAWTTVEDGDGAPVSSP